MNKRITALVWAVSLATAAAVQANGAAPTDPQIAAIVVTANQVDIDAGKLASASAQSKEVRTFAETMVTDHTAINQSAADLVHKLRVTPEANPTAASLQQGGDENLANLRKLRGAAFDKAYVDHEVAYHVAIIEALDQTLIRSASNAELKALLVKVRPAFVAHLEHARHLQAKLGASGG